MSLPELGYVYFDSTTGKVYCVTLREELDQPHPFILVSSQIVLDFLTSARTMSEWMVSPDDSGELSLQPSTVTVRYSDGPLVRVMNNPLELGGILRITVLIPPHGSSIGVRLDKYPQEVIATVMPNTTLDLTLVHGHDPDIIFDTLKIDLNVLLDRGYLPVRLSDELSKSVSIYARPLSSTSFDIQTVDHVEALVAVPSGRYEDVEWFEKGEVNRPALVLEASQTDLRVWLNAGGGEMYDRNLTTLALVVCQNRCQDEFHALHRVDVERLKAGDVITLPLNTTANFDVYTQKLFTNMIWKEFVSS